jgi:hypothetical protein
LTLFRCLARSAPTNVNFGLILFSSAPILTIFSHGQDYILSTLVLSIFLIQRKLNKVTSPISEKAMSITLGLLINWTNQSLIQVLLISAFYLIILRYLLHIDIFSMLHSCLLLALSTTVNAYLLSLGGDIQYLAYNFQALVFGICVFSLLPLSELDKNSNKINE